LSNFYTKYCKLCAEKGETASKAAVNMGFSRATATGWKNGKQPNDVTLVRIADYFGVPVSYFDDTGLKMPDFDLQLFAEDGLTAQEKALIAAFRPLDEVNRAKALVYIADLAAEG